MLTFDFGRWPFIVLFDWEPCGCLKRTSCVINYWALHPGIALQVNMHRSNYWPCLQRIKWPLYLANSLTMSYSSKRNWRLLRGSAVLLLWHLSFFVFSALRVNTKIPSFVSFTESIAVLVPDTKTQSPGSISKSMSDFWTFHTNVRTQLELKKKKHSPSSSNIYAWMPLEVETIWLFKAQESRTGFLKRRICDSLILAIFLSSVAELCICF